MLARSRIVLAAFALLPVLSASTPALAGEAVEAIARPRHDFELGFTVPGQVDEIRVKPGDPVEAGDVLVELADREEEAVVELWRLRAESDVQLRTAKKEHELAQVEAKRLERLVERNAAAPVEAERAQVEAEVAALKIERRKQESEEAKHQLAQAEARRARHVLKAPEAGVIEKVDVEVGETVQELKPVVRLVVKDPLRVDAHVPTGRTLDLAVGDPAWVTSTLPKYDEPIRGRIIHIAAVANAASETRLVRVEFPNRHELPAGDHVKVRFERPDEAAASAASAEEDGA